MAKEYQDVFVYAGAYNNVDDARMDYDTIHDLHSQDWIGHYQAAVFQKTTDGKVKVIDTTSTTRATGAKWGTAIGAVMGLIFPPSIIAGAAVGAGVGAVSGNAAKGWFKGDIKALADTLDAGQAGIVLVAEATPDLGAQKLLKRATRAQERQIDADAEAAKEHLHEMERV